MADPSDPASPEGNGAALTMTRRFAAPRERVFAAWADGEQLARWFGPGDVECTIHEWDTRAGGRYSLTMHHADGDETPLSGTFREVVPPRRIVCTWQWGGDGAMAGRETLLTLEFEAAGDGTVLRLTHALMPDQDWVDRHRRGWNGCFDCLDAYLAA